MATRWAEERAKKIKEYKNRLKREEEYREHSAEADYWDELEEDPNVQSVSTMCISITPDLNTPL